ncbi:MULTISPECIES: hypothetical protein [Flavobacterium]|uniref:Group-specific protein n=1 Tax=Flavobacterium suzhouense TaxID=1529638 RepID=A0ABW5NRQ5_9FLAO|nr:hypothetical protein [Flavobacterium sp. AG291]RDI11180.1 hypothetical protein DEU42_106114 [Flavobacterium sp. AG291]
MKSWIKFGLFWGMFMALVINVLFPLFDGTDIVPMKVLVSIPFWLVGGLIFGYVSRKKESKQ